MDNKPKVTKKAAVKVTKIIYYLSYSSTAIVLCQFPPKILKTEILFIFNIFFRYNFRCNLVF